jgi:Ser/Thr protein kinase RdoA (MazF antagonist)
VTSQGYSAEDVVFGVTEPEDVAARVDEWCRQHLGGAIVAVRFASSRLTSVFCLELDDGRGVVIKLQAGTVSSARLAAVYEAQVHLADAGFPCPRPIYPPTRVGGGWVVAEELLDEGIMPDPRRPEIRDAMAKSLAVMLRLTSLLEVSSALEEERPSWINFRTASLWPPAHHPRLDFLATGVEAPWIDVIALAAKRVLLAMPREEVVVGHSDYEAQNIRCSGAKVVAIYDWDSLVAEREEVIVGQAAAVYTAHALPDPAIPRVPTPEQRWAFVSAYERARGRGFDEHHRRYIVAASAWVTAYNARVNHAFGWGRQSGPGSHAEALRQLGHELETV